MCCYAKQSVWMSLILEYGVVHKTHRLLRGERQLNNYRKKEDKGMGDVNKSAKKEDDIGERSLFDSCCTRKEYKIPTDPVRFMLVEN